MATTARARLKIHDLGDGGLILIHEVDQPSYMILWDIEIPDFIYCSIATSGPLQSGLVGAKSLSIVSASGNQTVLSQSSESRAVVQVDSESSVTVFGAIRGGHC